jgi:hypothetical protein
VRCAEWFVSRNGYTDLPPVADSAQLAHESIELAQPAAALVAARRNTLARRAALVCAGAKRAAGYTVAFLAPGDTTAGSGRAVTMDTAFADLRVEHVGFLPRVALRDTASCHPLAGLPEGK